MPCYYPLPAIRKPGGGILVCSRLNPPNKVDLKVPCANCIGCRLDRSKQTAIRLMHEAQLHERNSFITLTYNEQTLASRRTGWEPTVPYTPPSGETSADVEPTRRDLRKTSLLEDSLRPRDVQLFMKKLRWELSEQNPSARVRYYLVGEYGDRYQRPHYHIALFGEDFSDDRIYWRTSGGHRCYRSSRLEKLWTFGNSEIGTLTIESAAYVASYVTKKVNGKLAYEHYRRENPETGEIFYLQPEFAYMSRRPGLGRAWLEKYHRDVYPHDYVVRDGMKFKPPRYYDKLLETWNPQEIARIRLDRELRALELAEDNTPARLAVKETVTKARIATKKRQLETFK